MMAVIAVLVSGCDQKAPTQTDSSAPVRGLVTQIVESAENTTVRRYPGVLEPKDITSLSFEVAGKLGEVDLMVGQRVAKGQVLAALDSEQFNTAIERQAAAVREIKAELRQAEEDLQRSEGLFKKGVVSKVQRDKDRTRVRTVSAQLVQAQKALTTAREDLKDASITAPFDGIINSVDADSFSTVAAGTAITSLYDAGAFEVSFSVNFEVISRLVVGTPVRIRLADDPSIVLDAVVGELGERADTVSSFPVVVVLKQGHPLIKAGMAVEVALEFQLPAAKGYLIPVSAAIPRGQIPEGSGPDSISPVDIYVFDPQSETVRQRRVMMAGIRGNDLLIIEGLEPGEYVAVAGVSFLREGMRVKLLEPRRPGQE